MSNLHRSRKKKCERERENSRRKRELTATVTEGAETWHSEGRAKALVTLRVTPNCALFLKPSQRHWGVCFEHSFKARTTSSFRLLCGASGGHKRQAVRHVEHKTGAIHSGSRRRGASWGEESGTGTEHENAEDWEFEEQCHCREGDWSVVLEKVKV